jgi:hypothetical protein
LIKAGGHGGLFQNDFVEEGLKPLPCRGIEDGEGPARADLNHHLKLIAGQGRRVKELLGRHTRGWVCYPAAEPHGSVIRF